jgi:hypothetical protein
MPQQLNIDQGARYAITCRGDFAYDVATKEVGEGSDTGEKEAASARQAFKLVDLDLRIPRGTSAVWSRYASHCIH